MQYFIIDTLNLAYRSHNVNFELKTSTDLYSGMFFGFARTLQALKKKYRGYKFISVWDNKPVEKYALQADYKAGRSPLPSSIMVQLDDIKVLLQSLGVDQYSKVGEEADDVIATLCEDFKNRDATTIVVYSNDKDLLQLVETGKVVVFKPKVGTSPEKFYDDAAVVEQFGVPPSKLALFRSLDGDASDNIRGIERVPRKIIASIVKESVDMKDFFERIYKEKLTDFQKKAFEEGKERIFVNNRIVALKRDLTGLNIVEGSVEKDRIAELFKKFEIRSLNSDTISDLFASSLNIRYSEARDTIKVESYSLF
jgi:DNA polymerase-1